MKLKDGTEIVVIVTDHTIRTALEDGFPDIDMVEVGSIYHRPRTEDCTIPRSQCKYTRHVWDDPACATDAMKIGVIVRRSIAHHISEPCPKPECFGSEIDHEHERKVKMQSLLMEHADNDDPRLVDQLYDSAHT